MNLAHLFGTDGIRGRFGRFPICSEIFRRLAGAIEALLRRKNLPLQIAIGRDGRRSGDLLLRWLLAGFSAGMEVLDLGVLATPVVSFAVRLHRVSAALSLTASHNGPDDNGLKLFDENGFKASEGDEQFIENWDNGGADPRANSGRPTVRDVHGETLDAYADALERDLRRLPSSRGRIVLDLANGAASAYGRRLMERFGWEVIALGDRPDGNDINVGCGSEHPACLAARVVKTAAIAGLALDGDGDRALLVDGGGRVIAGEFLLALLAPVLYPHERALVTTVQSNGGLDRFLSTRDWQVHRVAVGDRNVADELRRRGLHFGGEPSGHLIDLGFGGVSDGLHTGAQALAILGRRLDVFSAPFALLPSASASLPVREKVPIELLRPFGEVRDRAMARGCRLLVRYSGTEPKIRLLVEAETLDLATAVLDELVDAWHRSLS